MSIFADAELKKTDGAGRIAIGKENGGRLYAVQRRPNGDILLSPVVVRHEREAWLYESPEALEMVKKGLAQSARGEAQPGGDFTQYLDEDEKRDAQETGD
jgi:hypothetical protein